MASETGIRWPVSQALLNLFSGKRPRRAVIASS